MKPQPPVSLLLPNQVWAVVDSTGWEIETEGHRCGVCRSPATAGRDFRHGVHYRCDAHLDRYEWTEGGKVVRWRADPPFDNDEAERRRTMAPSGRVR
jgi:hypothetical protein